MPEPKTPQYWQQKGYQFFELGNCEACGQPVEFWMKANQPVPLDKDTLETHFSSCPNAQKYRQEQRMKAGYL
jgi:hypothetical protein